MELGSVALRSFVTLATGHANSRYFGETLLRVMNEAELDSETPLPTGYLPAVVVLGYLHSEKGTADFLYPADQRVLLDVLLRHHACIAPTSAMEQAWLAWIRTVGGIVLGSSQYKEGLHKAHEIIEAFKQLREELPDGEAKEAARAMLGKVLPVLGIAEKKAQHVGSGSGYGARQ